MKVEQSLWKVLIQSYQNLISQIVLLLTMVEQFMYLEPMPIFLNVISIKPQLKITMVGQYSFQVKTLSLKNLNSLPLTLPIVEIMLLVVQFILQDQIQLLKSLISKTVKLMKVEELFMHTVTMQKLKIPHSIQVLPNTVAPFI